MKSILDKLVFKSVKVWHLLLGVSGLLFLSILLQLSIAPLRTYESWKGSSEYYDSPTTDSLSRQLSYHRAMLRASSEDSIYLVVNIPDSLLTIYLKGVDIFSTRITRQEQSSFLPRLSSPIANSQFAVPQKAALIRASIEKEPIKVKIAPKNAEEAAKMATVPDSVSFDQAFLSYQLENGLYINLSSDKGYWVTFKMEIVQSASRIFRMIGAIAQLKILDYEPEINIKANNIDLTSIYRALPHEPYIIVRL